MTKRTLRTDKQSELLTFLSNIGLYIGDDDRSVLSGQHQSEFHSVLCKPNKHYTHMANNHISRSQFEAMKQGDQSMYVIKPRPADILMLRTP